MPHGRRSADARQIVVAAVRWLAENAQADILAARRHAALKLGIRNERLWPSPAEIETALREHQALFASPAQPQALIQLRRIALEAMRFLKDFDPRLTGPVLTGTADRHSKIRLLLSAETPEEVILHLHQHRLPYLASDISVELSRNRRTKLPGLRFEVEDHTVELMILDTAARRDPPRDPITGKRLSGATSEEVERLDQR